MKMSLSEAEKYLSLTRSGINNCLYRNKTIPYFKEKNKIFILKEDLDKYLSLESVIKNRISKKYNFNDFKEWLELYDNGYTFSQIAKKYNITYSTVSKTLKNNFPEFNFNDYSTRFSKEEKIIFKKAINSYYDSKEYSLTKVCDIYNINLDKFKTYLLRCGYSFKTLNEVRSRCTNPSFFEEIDSELKAYLLGFFAADGHLELEKENKCSVLKVSVHIKDTHILKLFNNALCDGKASINVFKTKENMTNFSVTSCELGNSLIKLGFDNKKTYSFKQLPSINDKLIRHFIRGIFDGDGSSMLNRRIANGKLSGFNRIIQIACHNKSVLIEIMSCAGITNYSFIENEAETKKVNGHDAHFKKSASLIVTNKDSIKQFYDYLYTDSNYYFKRKKDIFYLCTLDSDKIDAALQGNLEM